MAKQRANWMDSYKDVSEFFAPVQKPVIKYSIWRFVQDNTMPVPLFVNKDELKAGDLLFVEPKQSGDFEGYASVRSFTKDKNGNIVHWDLKPAGLELEKENKMLFVVEKLIKAAAEQGVTNTLIYLGICESVVA
jgi:hypothetical protein